MDYILKTLDNSITLKSIANVHFFEFPTEYYTKPDSHPFYELIFVSNGILDISSEDYNGRLKKNQMIMHFPNKLHSLSCEKKSAPTVIIIGFTCMENLPEILATAPIDLTPSDTKKIAEIIKEGRNVFAPPYDMPVLNMKKKKHVPFGAEQLLKNLIEYFLIGVCRKTFNLSVADTVDDVQGVSVDEIVNYVNDNYIGKITINELAFLFRTNRSTLCREFKKATGCTIIEYVNNKKISEAKARIENSNKTFTEISEELNFDSIHYFTRLFKQITGLSPKEYRKSVQEIKKA